MPSTFTSGKGQLEKQATGENNNTWGDKLNAVIDAVDDITSGRLSKSVAGGSDVTLTSAESLHRFHQYTGALTASINVIVPALEGYYDVFNNTTGDFSLTVKTSAGTGVAVPRGTKMVLYCDGTNVVKRTTLQGAANDDTEAKSADYTITADDHGKLLPMDASGANRTFTLPDPANEVGEGWICYPGRTDSSSNTVTIQRSGTATINGATSVTIDNQFDYVLIRCDGTNFTMIYMPNAVTFQAALQTTFDSRYARLAANNTFVGDQTIDGESSTAVLNFSSNRNTVGQSTGDLIFIGQNDAAEDVTYSQILSVIRDDTDGTEDGRINFRTIIAGSGPTNRLFIENGVYSPSATGGDQGADTANFSGVYDDGNQIHALQDGVGTPITTTSGTSHSFTGIRSDARRITFLLRGVSLSGTDELLIQVGDGSFVTAGYVGAVNNTGTGTGAVTFSSGFQLHISSAAGSLYTGAIHLYCIDPTNHIWIEEGMLGAESAIVGWQSRGQIDLTNALDRVQILPSGSDTFDAGQVNIFVE